MKNSNIIYMKNICKRFPGIIALDNVNFKAEGGKVNCIVGLNGAGKSTLIKVLAGVYGKDTGEIYFNDKLLNFKSLSAARKEGIYVIFQDTNLCENLTVLDNYTLGKEKNFFGILNKRSSHRKTIDDFKKMNFNLDLNSTVDTLSVAEKQMLEILKAVDDKMKVIVYDEPSSSLTKTETEKLFNIINNLKKENIIIIYISHRLEEIFEIGDTVTIMRDGKDICRKEIKTLTKNELIELMVGEKIANKKIRSVVSNVGDTALEVRNLSTSKFSNINFTLHQGEILGITGLLGSGYNEACRTLFGLEKITNGEVYYNNEKLMLNNPESLIKKGISFIPGKRREEGIFGMLSVLNNISISSIKKFTKIGVINKKKEISIATNLIKQMEIITPSLQKEVQELSGGNQQKVVLARWILSDSKIMLLIEPTHGIDVKTKKEIYMILNDLSLKGLSIIISSTEYAELAEICDRIIIFRKGIIHKIIESKEITEREIIENL